MTVPSVSGSDAASPPGRPLSQEFAEGTRTPRFMTAVLRQAVAVAGVLVLGWPAMDVAIFFVLESWLFMSFRAAAEVALDERTPGHGLQQTALYTALYVLAALPFLGAVVGCVAGFAIIPAFPAESWEAFKTTGSRETSFHVAVAFLVASLIFDTARHVKRAAAGRTPEARRADQREVRLISVRMLVLVAGSFALGASGQSMDKSLALVVAIAVVVVLIEALPERFGRMLPAPPELELPPELPPPPKAVSRRKRKRKR
jgi:hypothetical protein